MISAASIATTRAAGFLTSTFIINVLACSLRFDSMHVFFQADLWQLTLSPEGKTHSAPLRIFLIRCRQGQRSLFAFWHLESAPVGEVTTLQSTIAELFLRSFLGRNVTCELASARTSLCLTAEHGSYQDRT